MNKQERKKHWDAIYESKEHTEFSWFQKFLKSLYVILKP